MSKRAEAVIWSTMVTVTLLVFNGWAMGTPSQNSGGGAPLDNQASPSADSQLTPSAESQFSAPVDNQFSAPPPATATQTANGTPANPHPPLEEDGIHDPQDPNLHILQQPSGPLQPFPIDKKGEVDWVKTLQSGAIQPRASRDNPTEEMATLDLDLIMTDTKSMPHVRFPHLPHTQWLACENCHPDIFIPQAGANPISMATIFRGQHCGTCHGKVAFSVYVCERCHSLTHSGSPTKWW